MTSSVRVGIVGATVTVGGSGWGVDAHVPALHAVDGIELKAVCTSHKETAKASAEAFGAELAFHDIHDMVEDPNLDLVVVCVRVPSHHRLVTAALEAGKHVVCEWPLGATLGEAQEMADEARKRSLSTMIGLQARSDPAIRYARDLVADGYLGEVLVANVSVMAEAVLDRGPGRIWQSDVANRANPLTIKAGHSFDAVCFVLGEFATVSARLATRIRHWRDTETGRDVEVTAPDCVSVVGRLGSGIEIAGQVVTVPWHPSGARLEVQGRDGSLLLTGPSFNLGPIRLMGARGSEPMTELVPPRRYWAAPGVTAGFPRNVAQAYGRLVAAHREGARFTPDFDIAVRRHEMIDAIERSAAEGRAVTL